MRVGVVVFPGSNCDHDVFHVASDTMGWDAKFVWHKEKRLGELDLVILPGGFSYGDYLRAGAIARFSPIMEDVKRFADGGGTVVGICNGFQVLAEAGLLPGALMTNESVKFICRDVAVRVSSTASPLTRGLPEGEVLTIPIAHADGNYFVDEQTWNTLQRNNQIVFQYCDADGNVTAEANPNGSVGNVAGIVNERGNVVALMPHPERCADELLGNTDGLKLFEALGRA